MTGGYNTGGDVWPVATKKFSVKIKPSNKGKLRAGLKAKKGKNIPVSALVKAARSKSSTTRRRAQFALNARKWRKK